ncbi:protein derived from transposon [Anaeramoeba ignava]|uniref:Protein derived from transposon n=1 Tax=Anaeramoeba ignava TaxID=1746090 RepID=A0A9Q0LUV8_ANAIG|nr:protein derived from transposon [Anaeramoeba ignava]
MNKKTFSCSKLPQKRQTFQQKIDWETIYEQGKACKFGEKKHLAKALGVNYKTFMGRLHDSIHENPRGETSNSKRAEANRRRCCRLNEDQEEHLVKILNQKISEGSLVTAAYIRQLADSMIPKNQKRVSKNWPYYFISKHGFRFRKSKLMHKWPDSAESPSILAKRFFLECEEARKCRFQEEILMIDHSRVFNMDETNLKFVSSIKSVGKSDDPHSGMIMQSTKQNLTMAACIGADGTRLPPTFIVKATSGKILIPQLQKKFPEGRFLSSGSGWSNTQTMIDWLKEVFIPHITQISLSQKRSELSKVVLVLDQFLAHRKENFVNICIDNSITLVYVPGKMTGILQPLDKLVFSTFKKGYNSQILPIIDQKGKLARDDVIDSAIKSWNDDLTDLIWKSFRHTGVIRDNLRKFDQSALDLFEKQVLFLNNRVTISPTSSEKKRKKENIEKKNCTKNRKTKSPIKGKSEKNEEKTSRRKTRSSSKSNSKKKTDIKTQQWYSKKSIDDAIQKVKENTKNTPPDHVFSWRKRIAASNSEDSWLSDSDITRYCLLSKVLFKRQDVIVLESGDKEDIANQLEKFDEDFDGTWIIAPMVEERHWVLFLINKEAQVIEFFSSLNGYSHLTELGKSIAEKWKFDFLEVEFENSIQDNWVDCGVFVSKYIQLRIFEKKSVKEIREILNPKDGEIFRNIIFDLFQKDDLKAKPAKIQKEHAEIRQLVKRIRKIGKKCRSNPLNSKLEKKKEKKDNLLNTLKMVSKRYFAWSNFKDQ